MSDYLFSGLKVLDVATVIAGPAAAMMLADFGADVIKIEMPGSGDMLRTLSRIPTLPQADGDYLWQMDGRNKRSLTLNLKTPQGMQILRQLVADADVYITNQPYSVRESLGVTYGHLQPLNPRLIYASLTAYGEDGPERPRKGFDQVAYWARSGLMDLMREPDGTPVQGLPGMGDHPSAVSLYAGIVTALLRRERSGEGSLVHTSLLANGLWSAACVAQGAMAGGDMAGYRETNRVAPALLRVYRTRDGRWLQFNMVRDGNAVAAMFSAMGTPHLLRDERFDSGARMAENRQLLGELIQEVIVTRDADEWLEIFHAVDVPVNRVARVEETLDDPQIRENAMAVPAADELGLPALVNHPVRIAGVDPAPLRPAPRLGEHSAEVLAELGYDAAAVAALRDQGIV
jgi:crotonobetainyl-CoA:carnitine CoA-transferase CaiB-like acyl-CoA transferase